MMRNRSTRVLGVSGLLLLAAMGGCRDGAEALGMYDDGFRKVAYRVQDPIPEVTRPDPPPVIEGLGGGPAAIPTLAAGATPAGVTQVMVEEGAQLYGTVCSACHGAGGGGTPAAPALDDGDWINISGAYEDIVNVIHTGVANPKQYPGAMPALGGGNFNDEQVRAIAAYVFALANQGS